ncbi:MAG: fumarylacetoacetate hydrolase family protein [Chloroflexota bacterium]
MYLSRHQTTTGAQWAADGVALPAGVDLSFMLNLPSDAMAATIESLKTGVEAAGDLLPPIDAQQEVWACGVTYLKSREARKEESDSADVYEKVYDAERPETFFKSAGWRSSGHGQTVRIRKDSAWNVPEPELTLVINAQGEIVGYTTGNDMSSRDIEGENPLYLPQAKVYDGSCAVGPGIQLAPAETMTDLPITLQIERAGAMMFDDSTSTSQLKRTVQELVSCLYSEMSFPYGALLMTGTCLVPPNEFTLQSGDLIRIGVGGLVMENTVA